MKRPSSLQLASFQSFRCHSCGRCCRNSWTIGVEPSARAPIASSDIAAQRSSQGYLPLVVLEDQTVVLGRKEDGACVFLDGANLCGVHRELGAERKPLACQLYPYSLTETPEGDFASLSFACPAVVAGLGGDLEANRRDLEGFLALRDAAGEVEKRALPHRVEIAQGSFSSWQSYRGLEDSLLRAFRAEDPVGTVLSMVVGLLLHSTRGASDEGQNVFAAGLPDLRPLSREEGFEEAVLSMFCGAVIGLWEEPDDPAKRQPFSESVLAGEPTYSRRHGMTLPKFRLSRPQDPVMIEAFERYFQNAVVGKSLLAGTVVSRLLALACGFALLMYYGEAFRAAGAGTGALSSKDHYLLGAFELVEGELVAHTRSLDHLFSTFETTLRQAYGTA